MHCHHCGWHTPIPQACFACGNVDLSLSGFGTQQLEEALKHIVPDARIARIDADSTRGPTRAQKIFEAVCAGTIDILVETQMLSKGQGFNLLYLQEFCG